MWGNYEAEQTEPLDLTVDNNPTNDINQNDNINSQIEEWVYCVLEEEPSVSMVDEEPNVEAVEYVVDIDAVEDFIDVEAIDDDEDVIDVEHVEDPSNRRCFEGCLLSPIGHPCLLYPSFFAVDEEMDYDCLPPINDPLENSPDLGTDSTSETSSDDAKGPKLFKPYEL